jgi:AcrR family transcriptional regulator
MTMSLLIKGGPIGGPIGGAVGDAVTATGVRSRNRRGEGARLRDDILAAAAAILDETGDEHAVTLRAVARRVGISAPSIYPHFGNREEMLLALTRDAFRSLADHLAAASDTCRASGEPITPGTSRASGEPITPGTASVDATARLFAVGEAYLSFAAAHPERYRLMFVGVWDASRSGSITAGEAAALGQDALEILVDSLAACVHSGQSSSDNPFADVVALWLGLHGLAHQRTLSAFFPWPPDISERLIRSLAHLV